MHAPPQPWEVVARNLPEHADNPVHTDAGARAAGFPGALVAGVTTYVYLTRPLVAAWGLDWVERGGGEIRFRAPVFDRAEVRCVPTIDGDATVVDAVCPDQERNPRATLRAIRDAGPPPVARPGEPLPSRRFVVHDVVASDYHRRAGDDLTVYDEASVVHPAVWPALANRVFSTDLVDGSWVHTRSIIRHHALAPVGATVDVHATVVDRFERGGERAVADIVIEHDGAVVATIEHEAIVRIT